MTEEQKKKLAQETVKRIEDFNEDSPFFDIDTGQVFNVNERQFNAEFKGKAIIHPITHKIVELNFQGFVSKKRYQKLEKFDRILQDEVEEQIQNL